MNATRRQLAAASHRAGTLAERMDIAVRIGVLTDSTLVAQRPMPVHYQV